MNPNLTLGIILAYFFLLFIISFLTSRKADQQTFFTANRSSPWYLVAFGMIGASLSGVTFISIPGAVGSGQWGYMQIVLGYLVGYAVIALVLMPLYYRLNLTSIYGYLGERYGNNAYKMGAIFFLLSRIVGASLRLYLVALVLQLAICNHFGIPFEATVFISITLIYIYTFRGGIKTVVWTDTLQTFCMLLAAGVAVYVISSSLDWSMGEMIQEIQQSKYSKVFVWDWAPGTNFFKQFLSGAFIAIAMTGLDQDMMQKNLTCRNLKDAQKNVFWFSVVLVFANILFLSLGTLLYLYSSSKGILVEVFQPDWTLFFQSSPQTGFEAIPTDKLFPLLSLNYLGPLVGVVFVLGMIAAAYSSADSALTALTTSFCVDILNFEKRPNDQQKVRTRYIVHIGFALVLFVVILVFNQMDNDAVIWDLFRAAGYTYGPLLGMFAFGMFSKIKSRDSLIPIICIICPLLTYAIQHLTPTYLGFDIGFLILPVNGLLTMLGLWLIGSKS